MDVIKLKGFDFDNVLIGEKSYENVLICNISYKTLIGPMLLRIRFDKIDGFIRIYDGSKYLVLLGPAIYNKIRYLISLKGGITDVFSYYYTKIKVDSYDSLPTKKD